MYYDSIKVTQNAGNDISGCSDFQKILGKHATQTLTFVHFAY